MAENLRRGEAGRNDSFADGRDRDRPARDRGRRIERVRERLRVETLRAEAVVLGAVGVTMRPALVPV